MFVFSFIGCVYILPPDAGPREDAHSGCQHNKYTHEIHAHKPAKIPPQILRRRFLELEIRSVDLDLPSESLVINQNNEMCPFDI